MTFAPICVPCQREMRCRKTGYFFAEYDAAAIYSGDLFQCETCAARIIVGVGKEPVVYDYEDNFEGIRERHTEITLRRSCCTYHETGGNPDLSCGGDRYVIEISR